MCVCVSQFRPMEYGGVGEGAVQTGKFLIDSCDVSIVFIMSSVFPSVCVSLLFRQADVMEA